MTLFTDNEAYNVSSIISPRVNVAYMNQAETSPLHDLELRKAVSYAVNRDAYADLIGGSAAHSAYSDSTPFGNDTIIAYNSAPTGDPQIWLETRHVRGEGMAMIFQSAGDYLNPRRKVCDQYVETLRCHQKISKKEGYEAAKLTRI